MHDAGSRRATGTEADRDTIFEFKIFGWNVGGCDLADLQKYLVEGCGKPPPSDAFLALQELPRGKDGPRCNVESGVLSVTEASTFGEEWVLGFVLQNGQL